jgi:hypothetical protein
VNLAGAVLGFAPGAASKNSGVASTNPIVLTEPNLHVFGTGVGLLVGLMSENRTQQAHLRSSNLQIALWKQYITEREKLPALSVEFETQPS